MFSVNRKIRLVVIFLIVAVGVAPISVYWLIIGRAASASPDEAKLALSAPNANALLVDVRSESEFTQNHIDAAVNWPLDKIQSVKNDSDVPAEFQNKRLFLICQSGIRSAIASQIIHDKTKFDSLNVEGGMQAWIATAEKPCTLALCRMKSESGAVVGIPFKESSFLEQQAAVISGFFIKPLYTVLSLGIAIALSRRREADLIALRWAMIFFFVGENFCAINYLFFSDQSHLFEYLHSYGMILCFALTLFAFFEGFDRRILKLSDPESRCAAFSLCLECVKYSPVPCRLRRFFTIVIPAAAVLCFLPLTAQLVDASYNTKIWGTFYNYSHPSVAQLYEIRFLPAVALVAFLAAWSALFFLRKDAVLWAKIFFSAGAAALGFSFFRLILLDVYRDNLVWFGFWEEITELIFIVCAMTVLYLFRKELFR